MEKIKIKLPGVNDFFSQEAYKSLRTNLLFCGQDVQVIAFTSCEENEGKTTVSLHTAKSLSELGKKVLFIDADMRKSVMAGRNSNVRNVMGLSELLTGMAKVSDCLYTTQYPNLDIIFAGSFPPNPVELLGGKYFTSFVNEARKSFDYIIIDTPPLGMVIDAAVISSCCDGMVIVVNCGKARYHQVQEVICQLEKSGSKILGVVRNNSDLPKKGYYQR